MNVKRNVTAISAVLVLAIVLIAALGSSIKIVDESKTCAVVKLGNVVGKSRPGFQLVTPFITDFDCYPATAVMFQTGTDANQKADYWDYPVEIKTSDGQTGSVVFNVLYSVDPEFVEYIRANVAQNERQLNERIIANFARSVPRDVAAEYTADGLYAADRAAFSQDVTELLGKEFKSFGVKLVAFELRDVQFSEDYEDAIEQQQIQEENIQTAQFVTEQKKQEAEQARIAAQGRADSVVIEAKAEAQALELVAEALRRNPNILQYEYIKKIAPNIKVMMIPQDQEFIYTLPDVGQ